MKKMKPDQHGSSVVELFLILGTVVIVGFVGWYAWHLRLAAGGHKERQLSTPPTVITHQKIAPKAGWSIYKSAHSSAEFRYPAGWKLSMNQIDSSNTYTLESLLISGTNSFTILFSLNKTNHNPVVYNAACTVPPKVSVLTLSNKRAISYASYNGLVNDVWLGSTGNTPKGYGYATGQCRNRGVDYIALPNDEFILFDGSYVANNKFSSADFLKQPEVKTALAIFESLSP
jgi:hypothetical protein